MGEQNIHHSREPMSDGQMESSPTAEIRGCIKLHAWFDELLGLAAEGRGGGGRAEIGEGVRV